MGEQRVSKSMGSVRLRQRVVYGDAVACLFSIDVPRHENHVLKGIGLQNKKGTKIFRLIFSLTLPSILRTRPYEALVICCSQQRENPCHLCHP